MSDESLASVCGNDATTLWAWVIEVPGRGIYHLGATVSDRYLPLIAPSHDVAELMRDHAQIVQKKTGNHVWLREYRVAADHGDA